MSDTIWKLGAFLFAAAALPAGYITILAVSGGFNGAPIMRFLGALLAFMIALGIGAVYRRSHGGEAGGLERLLIQLATSLVFILLVGTVFPLFQRGGNDQDLSAGMLLGTAVVIAWFGYRHYKNRA